MYINFTDCTYYLDIWMCACSANIRTEIYLINEENYFTGPFWGQFSCMPSWPFRKWLWGNHKLRWQDFEDFWPPLCWQVHYISLCSIVDIWETPLPLACQRSIWMPPWRSSSLEIWARTSAAWQKIYTSTSWRTAKLHTTTPFTGLCKIVKLCVVSIILVA